MRSSVAVIIALWAAAAQAHALEAGAAKIDITPPLETPLNGYIERLGRGAMSVHDPLSVRCLYLSEGETALFLINADLCIINRELRTRVLELAPSHVPKENIILTATHTHNGHGGMVESIAFRTVSGRYMPEVLDATANRFAEAMRTAYESRKRGTIGYGFGDLKGLAENRQVEEGPTDPQVGVIRVDDSDGNKIAILANFAAHPTTVGSSDWLAFSADFPGYYYNEIERLANPGCVAMFLNGAAGNQRPANPGGLSGWEHTAFVGRTLAQATMEAAEKILCGDATLRVAHSTPALPPTLASALLPSDIFLQTLEINDLVIAFVPGEPCVEVGLELRRRARARGYGTHMTVGVANDYLFYVVPESAFVAPSYESSLHFYGPSMDQWLYDQFGMLMTRGEQAEVVEMPEASPRSILGASVITVAGTPEILGRQLGGAFADRIRTAFERYAGSINVPTKISPQSEFLASLPSFIDTSSVTLPMLASSLRARLADAGPDVFEELKGLAENSNTPFDALWLLQWLPVLGESRDRNSLFSGSSSTMVAAVGDRAGADDLLIGRNFDWPVDEEPVVVKVITRAGRPYIQIGFPWNVGVFTGMNDAGLTVSVERVPALGTPTLDGLPVNLILRDVLTTCASVDEATDRLVSHTHLRGYHVLVAGPGLPGALVLEFGPNLFTREAVDGLLVGVDPTLTEVDRETATRYRRLQSLLETERIVTADELKVSMADSEASRTGTERILNNTTRFSAIFEPTAKKVHVAFPTGENSVGDYTTFGFDEAP
ncbi:MAG: hypothetical protein AMXMBFR84_45800 [Candidatus Hydrogenedentota bacterium]